MDNSSGIVAKAIVGADSVTVFIGGKGYSIPPPTIQRIAGAGIYLSEMPTGETINDILAMAPSIDNLAHALSWFIAGNDSLVNEFLDAEFDEVMNGLLAAYSLLSTENFIRLSTLVRNVQRLIANPRQ